MFKVSARTILELGSELISSDIIAFYELIKNSFDAKTKNGVEIVFDITLKRNDFIAIKKTLENDVKLNDAKNLIIGKLNKSSKYYNSYKNSILKCNNLKDLSSTIENEQKNLNKITIKDTGSGMSFSELENNFLVIGTSSRKKDVDLALENNESTPYLGEKGIGRLSVMRLGGRLSLRTTKTDSDKINTLYIDWSVFENLDLMLEQVKIEPKQIDKEESDFSSGCNIEITDLTEDWTEKRVEYLAQHEFSRIIDPFIDPRKRPRVAIFWNGSRIAIPLLSHNLLDHCHAKVIGNYEITDGKPVLNYHYTVYDAGIEHPIEEKKQSINEIDLHGLVLGDNGEISSDALVTIGAFQFEAYWFNRRKLHAIEGIGDLKTVRELQRQWSGILLFRDGFRVYPYGEDDDDWLSLDRKALANTGYTLNKAQFVGKIDISRTKNPYLIDQTNREGLRVTDEQKVLTNILKYIIQENLLNFLKEIKRQYEKQKINIDKLKTDIITLESRASNAVSKLNNLVPEKGKPFLEDLQQTIFEFSEFSRNAKLKIEESEKDNLIMTELAGIGLMSEIIAHELARTAENAIDTLDSLKNQAVPAEVRKGLEVLRVEMKSLNKRLMVLNPVSVSGRQKFERMDLLSLIDEIIDLHSPQFKRHGIKINFIKPNDKVIVKAVKGMLIQILANLISNSKYWMSIKKEMVHSFEPKIEIIVENSPPTIIFRDNGTGISPENRDNVFKVFFSLKNQSKRRGLGLYIAKENAEYLKGNLILDNEIDPDTQRLHTFIIELPELEK